MSIAPIDPAYLDFLDDWDLEPTEELADFHRAFKTVTPEHARAFAERVYYAGVSTFEDDEQLLYGQCGTLCPTVNNRTQLEVVAWDGLAIVMVVKANTLRQTPPPPLPGGYLPGESVYRLSPSETFTDDGDILRVFHGQEATVVGPATADSTTLPSGRFIMPDPELGVAVYFTGLPFDVNCPLNTIGRDPPPPLPNGYQLGERLYYLGHGQQDMGHAERTRGLTHGEQYKVVGSAPGGNGQYAMPDMSRLAIELATGEPEVYVSLSKLSREAPPPR